MAYVGTELFRRDILEEHFESLEFLWGQRRRFLRAGGVSRRDLVDHDERIAAHADGLVLAGADGVDLVRPALGSEDGSMSLAAAHVLLGTGDAELSRVVLDTLVAAPPPARLGIGRALCCSSIDLVETELQRLAGSSDELLAAITAETLASHDRLLNAEAVAARLIGVGGVEARRAAWRTITLLAGSAGVPPIQRAAFERGAADEDPEVRALALEAAAWWRQPWLLERCRADAQSFSPAGKPAAVVLAALGGAQDLDLMRALGDERAMGADRFDVLASYGPPALLEPLLVVMAAAAQPTEARKAGGDEVPADPRAAAAAGAAFTRITGVDVASGRRVSVPAASSASAERDAFDEEFLDDVELPDAAAATAALAVFRESAGAGTRFFRGTPIGGVADGPHLLSSSALDPRARWEMALRLAHAGRPAGTPGDHDRFPQRP
jgi:uncharacterized protein (TIGR02270 family)